VDVPNPSGAGNFYYMVCPVSKDKILKLIWNEPVGMTRLDINGRAFKDQPVPKCEITS